MSWFQPIILPLGVPEGDAGSDDVQSPIAVKTIAHLHARGCANEQHPRTKVSLIHTSNRSLGYVGTSIWHHYSDHPGGWDSQRYVCVLAQVVSERQPAAASGSQRQPAAASGSQRRRPDDHGSPYQTGTLQRIRTISFPNEKSSRGGPASGADGRTGRRREEAIFGRKDGYLVKVRLPKGTIG